MNKLNIVELFGGIGAIRKAFIDLNLDFQVIDYVENNPNAVKAYNLLYDDNRNVLNVEDYHLPTILDIDLLFHGSPCQDFSVSGKNKGGKKGSNTRSSLLWETIRIIEETQNKPLVVIWENVKNVLSKKHKKVFDQYLNKMKSLGYENSFKVINALSCGIPQKRERVFVVSILKKHSLNKGRLDWIIKFNNLKDIPPRNLSEFLSNEVDKKYFLKYKSVAMIKAVLNKKIRIINGIFTNTITTMQWRWNNAGVVKIPFVNFNAENYVLNTENENAIVRTITATGANSKQKIAVVSDKSKQENELAIFLIDDKHYYLRVITPKEAILLMGFSGTDYEKLETNLSNNQIYKLAGNSIVVDCLKKLVNSIFV
ncbi:DNA cytosine methyltransferase [Metamycoplasma hyosynoviae]|uniref:DNA cytosine methyltransferase n=2 Tax=Metamycoplasma hyosynoviae TaxID=29559 RepID=UPI0023598271|nr:DNA cytosine methyltransferase [Metamycoplasma hyosynoviae]MDC8962295.1 DNA cytosine methyltransferase [Metamycoplasma hyosynoviae]MDD7847519.1 DNA cytosine methyltransferase [Metamycoplasma hyosynoviae]MDD7912412.1 DNA cytosine methyltransferase [Metamycoplasma hyosynoviae]